jgi:hypothetical protein
MGGAKYLAVISMNDQSLTYLGKPNTGDYFEGSKNFMRAVSPRPYVFHAESPNKPHLRMVFREDSYDPTTRIRRGRFYQVTDGFHLTWDRIKFEPYIRPAAFTLTGGVGGAFFQFSAQQTDELMRELIRLQGYEICIGARPVRTLWKIVDAESLADGGVLYTLRTRSAFGLLPPLLEGASSYAEHAYQGVSEAALRYDADAIVDACRNGASKILGEHCRSPGIDLGLLANNLREMKELALASSANILARLHSRTKPSEQARQNAGKRPIRVISEDDALLAIRLFGFILQDLGLSK